MVRTECNTTLWKRYKEIAACLEGVFCSRKVERDELKEQLLQLL